MAPFRFAVQLSGAPTVAAWRDLCRRCEELGYSTVYIPDHLDDQWAPLVALTVAAEATSTLRVGTLVLDNDYRHPVVLAKEVATLDLVSGGRVELGIGAGWMRSDYDQSGIPYDPAGTRVDRLAEAVTVLKGLWADGSTTFAGRHYTVAGAQCRPGPPTRPHPPLLIGGGSRRVLGLAAREADIVGVNPRLAAGVVGPEVAAETLPAKFDERIGWVREAAGDRIGRIELQCLTFFVQVGVEPRKLAADLAPMFGLAPEEVLDVPIALAGSVDDICDTLEQRRERWGFSYWVIHEAELDAFAPVVARMAGR